MLSEENGSVEDVQDAQGQNGTRAILELLTTDLNEEKRVSVVGPTFTWTFPWSLTFSKAAKVVKHT